MDDNRMPMFADQAGGEGAKGADMLNRIHELFNAQPLHTCISLGIFILICMIYIFNLM